MKPTKTPEALITYFKPFFLWNSIKKRGNRPKDIKPPVATRIFILIGILSLSRLGVYIPVSPDLDIKAFSESLESSDGLVRYLDALSGSSISRVGLFSLGIVPYINASIVIQLMTSIVPELKKLQKDGGPSARQKFSQYLKTATLIFSIVQGIGQLNYLRPFVPEFSNYWLFENSIALSTGAMILTFLSSEIDKLKIGNGTSLLVFTSILSALPTTLASTFRETSNEDSKTISILLILTLVTTLGVVYVQEAERKIPINYASRARASFITKASGETSYLPFKVNATGVMPIIFASSFLALPSNLSRFSDIEIFQRFASSLNPDSPMYILYNVGMIYLFNYFYTFIQFEPNDLSENLKKSGASIPAVRPGKATAIYFERTLTRLSFLGSAFLSSLAVTPLVAAACGITRLSGFGATTIIILVGVATDFTRRLRAEKILEEYKKFDYEPPM